MRPYYQTHDNIPIQAEVGQSIPISKSTCAYRPILVTIGDFMITRSRHSLIVINIEPENCRGPTLEFLSFDQHHTWMRSTHLGLFLRHRYRVRGLTNCAWLEGLTKWRNRMGEVEQEGVTQFAIPDTSDYIHPTSVESWTCRYIESWGPTSFHGPIVVSYMLNERRP